MKRLIFNDLIKWKNAKPRKVLLIRGARQVGKTYIVRELGKEFKSFIEVNFDSEPEIARFFEGNLNPHQICEKLSVYYDTPIIDNETLLFFDEIQSCIPAMQSLRYFYEKRSGLHVIATGSLLEFALEEIPSFGVGRISSVYMFPMSFNEFLLAANQESLLKAKEKATLKNPVNEVFHNKLNEWLRKYFIIGGMPEAVRTYVETGDILKTQTVLDDITNSLEDDFAKYKKRINTGRLKDVFRSVLSQTGNRYNVSASSDSGNQEQKNEALEMLVMAGLCYKVHHSSANGIPLSAERNLKKFKVIFFDTGISQRVMKLQLKDFISAETLDQINKGNIAEQFVGNEIVKCQDNHSKPALHYWQREQRGSQAEVDYLIEQNRKIIPIEVKSGTRGQMQSLQLFLETKKIPVGVRISMENFSQYQNIEVYPLYAIENLFASSSSR